MREFDHTPTGHRALEELAEEVRKFGTELPDELALSFLFRQQRSLGDLPYLTGKNPVRIIWRDFLRCITPVEKAMVTGAIGRALRVGIINLEGLRAIDEADLACQMGQKTAGALKLMFGGPKIMV